MIDSVQSRRAQNKCHWGIRSSQKGAKAHNQTMQTCWNALMGNRERCSAA